MNYQLAVLDMAGTTVQDDDAVNTCLRAAMTAAGLTATRDDINEVMGLAKPLAIRLTMQKHGHFHGPESEARVQAIHGDFLARMLHFYRTSPAIREVAGASTVFEKLHQAGIKIALDTGFSRPIAQAIIDRLGWQAMGHIDASVTSDEVISGRPEPDMIFRAMKLTGVTDMACVIKVGDTPSDLQQGTNANCGLVVGVVSGSHTREQLASHPHTHLIHSIVDLPDLVLDGSNLHSRGADRLLFTPGPLTTSRAVKNAMVHDMGSRDTEFIELIQEVRTGILEVAGTSKAQGFETVPIQGSGTFGVESAIGSLVPRDGKLLVLRNGAYGQRMVRIAQMLNIPVVAVESSPRYPVDAQAVEKALAEHPDIRIVAMVHCETSSGVINPIETIGPMVRRAGKIFMVDAMSSFGAVPIDLEAAGIDALIASANKCLEGVPGISFVIARRTLLEASAGYAHSHSLDLVDQWRVLEATREFRFTPPIQVVLALAVALLELRTEGGVPARAARYRRNHSRLIEGMRELGFQEYVPPVHQSYIITAFKYLKDPHFVFEAFYQQLADAGYVVYGGKLVDENCFRVGNIGRLNTNHVDSLLAAMARILETMGVVLPEIAPQQKEAVPAGAYPISAAC